MKRIWHPYYSWEDFKAGMWRRVSKEDERRMLDIAISFTGDAEQYGSYMMKVINLWPVSCEHNLTDHSLNKLAWVGHAACALAYSLPEYIVRHAWGRLTDRQREAANIRAQAAVDEWLKQYEMKRYGWQTSFEF